MFHFKLSTVRPRPGLFIQYAYVIKFSPTGHSNNNRTPGGKFQKSSERMGFTRLPPCQLEDQRSKAALIPATLEREIVDSRPSPTGVIKSGWGDRICAMRDSGPSSSSPLRGERIEVRGRGVEFKTQA